MDRSLAEEFQRKQIDGPASERILQRLNGGLQLARENGDLFAVDCDGKQVVDASGSMSVLITTEAVQRLQDLLGENDTATLLARLAPRGVMDESGLEALGLELLPWASYGILNGGAATSFVDLGKNQQSYPEYFGICQDIFERWAPDLKGKPKALAPAFFNADGSPGPSFLALKLRSLSLLSQRYQREHLCTSGNRPEPLFPWIQMVNEQGRPLLEQATLEFANSKGADPGNGALSFDSARNVLTASQNLIAAFAPPDGDGRYHFFLNNGGIEGEALGLPGGHGQVYETLHGIFLDLLARGKRYVWIGNIDNLGNTPNLRALAMAVLRGAEGVFEFSFKTPLDTKGGILVRSADGTLTCADIGQSISQERVNAFEAEGKPILFNCATGLFDLAWLVGKHDLIQEQLPLRPTLNKKDNGTYIAVERSAWEIMSLMKDPLVLAVEKSKRFLASKFFLDSVLTSGVRLDQLPPGSVRTLGATLFEGLQNVLGAQYGLHRDKGIWK